MKISQIMLAKEFGGAERYFLDLSLALTDAGHQVQVICHNRFVALPLLKERKDIDLRTISVWGKWDPLAPRQLFRLLKGFNPDVVHAHLARGALMAGKAARGADWPLVVKTHNYVDLKYYGSVDHFITTTQDQFNYLTSHGIAGNRISVIPNFSRITPVGAVRKLPAHFPIFVAYGRMVHKKGFDLLLEAFGKLLSSGTQARLLIGGDGPERSHLEKQVVDLEISSYVEFSGWINDVPAFLARGDVFILPSRDEPFGIAIIEAMACGMPVIATLTKGPVEILDETTAFLVPAGNAEALASAMDNVLMQPERSARLASAALDLYRNRYHENVILPQLLALYRGLRSSKASLQRDST